jgi:peptidoglycan/xylan/chitin deacetylase (PgdA/CDA1 family)
MNRSAAAGVILRRLGICSLILRARQRGWVRRDALTILGYHRIAPLPTDGFSGEDDNISCGPAQFNREVKLLRRFFTPLGFGDLLAARRAGRRLPPNPLIVTFDDGYRDNYEVAAPVLQRHRVTACFFLTTGFLDGEARPWWDAINLALRRAPAGRLRLASLGGMEFAVGSPATRARAALALRRRFKALEADRYEEVLAELGRAAGCDLGLAPFRDSFMTWEQARQLEQQGFEIGAHTRTHPVLSQLATPEQLEAEVAGARRELQERLEKAVITLAYPVGSAAAVNPAVVEAARRAGFAFACTFIDGVNQLGRLDEFYLRRIAVGAAADYGSFYAKMAFPWLFRRTTA